MKNSITKNSDEVEDALQLLDSQSDYYESIVVNQRETIQSLLIVLAVVTTIAFLF
tara:strand:+ start:399 stop:563 length:165 start_codon:yes stop_codon:yes gene_type:complete